MHPFSYFDSYVQVDHPHSGLISLLIKKDKKKKKKLHRENQKTPGLKKHEKKN